MFLFFLLIFLCFSTLTMQEFTMHDTIGCYLDLEKAQISFSKNGSSTLILF